MDGTAELNNQGCNFFLQRKYGLAALYFQKALQSNQNDISTFQNAVEEIRSRYKNEQSETKHQPAKSNSALSEAELSEDKKLHKELMDETQSVESQGINSNSSNNNSVDPFANIVIPDYGADRKCEILYNYGIQMMLTGFPELASACFHEAALKLYSKNPAVWLKIAECCLIHYEKIQLNLDNTSTRNKLLKTEILSSGSQRSGRYILKSSSSATNSNNSSASIHTASETKENFDESHQENESHSTKMNSSTQLDQKRAEAAGSVVADEENDISEQNSGNSQAATLDHQKNTSLYSQDSDPAGHKIQIYSERNELSLEYAIGCLRNCIYLTERLLQSSSSSSSSSSTAAAVVNPSPSSPKISSSTSSSTTS